MAVRFMWLRNVCMSIYKKQSICSQVKISPNILLPHESF